MNTRQATIMIVEDDERSRRLLQAQLDAEGYATQSATSGSEALSLCAARPPDLVLLDIMMPGMDGFTVAARLKSEPRTKAIPIIMVTALEDRDSRMRALEVGAEEFLTKPVDRSELRIRVRNLLRLKEYQDFLADHARLLEAQVAERTAQLRAAYRDTIVTMVRAAEYKDEETGAHVQRIGFYCQDLAETMGMPAGFIDEIVHASPMHDIGKIGIPDAVLLKPGALDADEWRIMRSHTVKGWEILHQGGSPYTTMGAEIALAHHERWDGSGYPKGLAGEAIPLAARMMNLADIYDALRSKRPYKPAFTHERAMTIITEGDGRTQPSHFDPQVLAAFVRSAGRWRDIHDTMAD